MTSRPARGVLAAGVAVLLAGCGGTRDPGPAGSPAAGVTVDVSSDGAASGGAVSSGDTSTTTGVSSAGPFDVATGLDTPWGLAFLPSGDALVAERDSGIIVLESDPTTAPTEVAVVPGVVPDGEGGLLGLAVSPDYATDGLVYAYLTAADDNRIVRFRLDPESTTPRDVEVVLDGIDKAGFHNGGRIAFGPDGLLYAGTGDAGQKPAAQDQGDLNGKILRMTPTGGVPADNPFPGSVVYSMGHRNVQGLAWDSSGRLWATEFGQNERDEVNLIQPGNNYGWPEVEGEGDTQSGRFTNPQVTWATSEASPSGAAVVSTADGDVLYVAALRGQRLWRVPLSAEGAGTPVADFEGEYGRLRTVVAAPDGRLWFTTSNTDGRGEPRDGDDRIVSVAAGS
jgi:glucose/arabinose dehydrogenase